MRDKSLKNNQILRAHMPYFRSPGHKYILKEVRTNKHPCKNSQAVKNGVALKSLGEKERWRPRNGLRFIRINN